MDTLTRTESVAARATLTRRQRRAQVALGLACIVLGSAVTWAGINVAADSMDAHLDAVSPIEKVEPGPTSLEGFQLEACPTEDSSDCYWDDSLHGDNGRSFVDLGGVAYYLPEVR